MITNFVMYTTDSPFFAKSLKECDYLVMILQKGFEKEEKPYDWFPDEIYKKWRKSECPFSVTVVSLKLDIIALMSVGSQDNLKLGLIDMVKAAPVGTRIMFMTLVDPTVHDMLSKEILRLVEPQANA